jgi:hypothetical protein
LKSKVALCCVKNVQGFWGPSPWMPLIRTEFKRFGNPEVPKNTFSVAIVHSRIMTFVMSTFV